MRLERCFGSAASLAAVGTTDKVEQWHRDTGREATALEGAGNGGA